MIYYLWSVNYLFPGHCCWRKNSTFWLGSNFHITTKNVEEIDEVDSDQKEKHTRFENNQVIYWKDYRFYDTNAEDFREKL